MSSLGVPTMTGRVKPQLETEVDELQETACDLARKMSEILIGATRLEASLAIAFVTASVLRCFAQDAKDAERLRKLIHRFAKRILDEVDEDECARILN
jgi:hypothetical protein